MVSPLPSAGPHGSVPGSKLMIAQNASLVVPGGRLRLIDHEARPQRQPRIKRPPCDVYPGSDRLTQKVQREFGELDGTQVPLLRRHQAQTCPGCRNSSNQPGRKIASIGAGQHQPETKKSG